MKRAGRPFNLAVGSLITSMALGVGGLVIANPAAATQPMTATTYVNLRSGPGTSYSVVSVLAPDETVTALGTVTGGWYQVTTAKGTIGWVYQTYLRASSGSAAAPTSATPAAPATAAPTASGQATTTAAVNVRSGPGTSYGIVGVAAKGTTLGTPGTVSGGWTQVIYAGVARWISTSYLNVGSASSGPVAAGRVKTTANLYLRTEGDLAAPYTGVLPAGSIVDTTGNTTADYTEVIVGGQTRWIATRYTTAVGSSGPSAPAAPAAVGKVYVTVNLLNVRATSAADGAIVGQVSRGTALDTTGVTENNRTQVIYHGVARWVYSPYVSSSAPTAVAYAAVTSSGISQLTPNAKAVYDYVVANFTQIRTIYGWRASSDYSSDHPNGRAVDIMIPDWSVPANADYGWEIAHYFQNNAATYKISYIIYRQQLWNAAYPDRGWRLMEDRGSVTANHYDHVHVSVQP